MISSSPLRAAASLAVVVVAAASAAACGDLVIPSNVTDGGSTDDDSGSSTDDGGARPSDAAPAGDAGLIPDCNRDGQDHPTALACTGLYGACDLQSCNGWLTRTIAPDAHAFDPGLHLWSDGADKSRWIYLPPNTRIDTTNLNEWLFPIGTKVWKEFRLLGKRVETRFLWKVSPLYWFRTTYEWSDDETQANELVGGRGNVRGLGYEIPNTDVCASCHAGRLDFVLGFEIVSLASSQSSGFNLAVLRQQQLLTNPPVNNPVVPGDATAVGAVGFLHSNCGNACHNRSPSALAGASGLLMRLDVDATGALPPNVNQTDLWLTAYKVPSTFVPAGNLPGTFFRIKPQDVAHSAIPYRDGRRDGISQMPPLATHIVDTLDLKKVDDWINSLPP
jgi:hypothetical protein